MQRVGLWLLIAGTIMVVLLAMAASMGWGL
jgi:hypothetical protein